MIIIDIVGHRECRAYKDGLNDPIFVCIPPIKNVIHNYLMTVFFTKVDFSVFVNTISCCFLFTICSYTNFLKIKNVQLCF